MAQWSSSYIEQALSIPKVWGDICGVAMFGVMLGLGRTLYAKFGKNIGKVLLLCTIGASVCYLTCIVVPVPIIGLIACALTGFCTSMLWPGSLIVAEHKIPAGGVFIFAMMAAGGDLGASVGPQLVGVITDSVLASSFAPALASSLSLSVEALAMKAGLAVGLLFPLVGIIIFSVIFRSYKKEKQLGQCLETK
jgi:MFS family permease